MFTKKYGGGMVPAASAPLANATTPDVGLANTGTALNSGAVSGVGQPLNQGALASAPLSSGQIRGGK